MKILKFVHAVIQCVPEKVFVVNVCITTEKEGNCQHVIFHQKLKKHTTEVSKIL